RRVLPERLTHAERRIAVHGHVHERVHVRRAAEVKHRRRALQTKNLILPAPAHLAVRVVAEKERFNSAVMRQTLPGIGDILGRIARQDPLDQLANKGLALLRAARDRRPRERPAAPLELDLRLDGRRLEQRLPLLAWIQAAEQLLADLE